MHDSRFIKFGIAHSGGRHEYDVVFHNLSPRRLEGIVNQDGVQMVLMTLHNARTVQAVLEAVLKYNQTSDRALDLLRPTEDTSTVVLTFSQGNRMHEHAFFQAIVLQKRQLLESTYWLWEMGGEQQPAQVEKTTQRVARELHIDMTDAAVRPSGKNRRREVVASVQEPPSNKKQKTDFDDDWDEFHVSAMHGYECVGVSDGVLGLCRLLWTSGTGRHFRTWRIFYSGRGPSGSILGIFFPVELDLKHARKKIQRSLPHMSYPFLTCKGCEANVQREWPTEITRKMPSLGRAVSVTRFVPVTAEFDSDDFANNCRGQGWRYARKRKNQSIQLVPDEENEGSSSQPHFNFQGLFEKLCCFCSLQSGYGLDSFAEIGCYHCKRREILFLEFSRLKRARKSPEKNGGEVSLWKAHGWGGLSDALIDHILFFAINYVEGSKTSA